MCCVARAVSWATWLLFTGVPARCVVLLVRCPGPLCFCSPVSPLGVLCCVCGVLGHSDLFTCVPATCVASLVQCPGPLGSCSPVCPLAALCCVCGVMGHLAPVHRCSLSVCSVAPAVSWVPWLLLTAVPARCVVLHVQCPWPLGFCAPLFSLDALRCVCGVLSHLASVHRCACLVRHVWCVLSSATWLLFTAVHARCVVLRVRCPGPLGSCSPFTSLGALRCVRGVLGHLAPVHRCARSVRRVWCAVFWATWLPFTAVDAQCVVLRVRRPGPLSSCSPVCSLDVSCCVSLVWCCVCGASLQGAHSSIRTAAFRSRQGLGTLRARTRPSGRQLFRSQQGRGTLPGDKFFHPDGSCSVAGKGWVRCRACRRRSGRQLVLLGTCSRALVRCVLCPLSGFAAPRSRCCLARVRVPWLCLATCLSGVPRDPAWCAARLPVRSLSMLWWAFLTPWCVSPPRRLAPLALWGGCAGHVEAGREPGSFCLPLAPAKAGALGSLRVVHVRCPEMGLSLAGPSGVGLGLLALRWLACVDPVARPVSRTVCRWTGDSASAPGLFRVDAEKSPFGSKDAMPGSRARVCVLVLPGWVGQAGLSGMFWCASPFLWPLRPSALLGPLQAGLAPFLSFWLPSFFPSWFFFLSFARLCCLLISLVSSPGCLGPWPCVFFSPPATLVFFFFSLCAPVVSYFFWFPAPAALGLGAVWSPPPLPRMVFFCSGVYFLLPSFFSFPPLFFFFFPPAFPAPPPPPPPPTVCFVDLLLLGPHCALAAFVFPAWPLATPLWLLPPPPFVSRDCRCCRSVFCVFPLLLCSCLLAWRLSAVLPDCCPPLCCLLSGLGLRCRLLCCAVSLGAVLRRAAAHCAARCCAVVCCVVLFRSFVAAACCDLTSGAARCPGVLCFLALCFAVFPGAVCSVLCVFCCGVLVRAGVCCCVLCCVCPGVLCCAGPVSFAPCGAVLRCAGALAFCSSRGARCCWRLVSWCVVVCCAVSFGVLWCGAGSGCPWLFSGGLFRCQCSCLAAWPASL